MTSDTAARVKRVMSLAFRTPIEEINDAAAIMSTPGWDSLGHATLMAVLEDEFMVQLPLDAQLELQTLTEIVSYLDGTAGS